MSSTIPLLVLALLAGASVPLGALVSSRPRLARLCLRHELDSLVSYLGGGALLAAIALVLVPFGMEQLRIPAAALAFLTGGIAFWLLNGWLKRRGGSGAQYAGMLLDFFPEALLLGASGASDPRLAALLALLIAVQNMPEGFAAYQELRSGGMRQPRLWTLLLLAPLVGPGAAWLGESFFSSHEAVLAGITLFCSGGILYLIFDDIVPAAHLEHRDYPALGAVSGFLVGIVGTMVVHGAG